VDSRPTGSKLDLIQAAALAISRFGLSALTSARIATAAGHTAASINFHFGSKDALLLATLREVSDEFAGGMAQVLDRCGLVRLPRRVERTRGLPTHLRCARSILQSNDGRSLRARDHSSWREQMA
jgi:AcrR family transcriptional regulator